MVKFTLFNNFVFGVVLSLGFSFGRGTLASAEVGRTAGTIPDTQIVKILMKIDDGEIEMGKLAVKLAQNQEVKDFAKMMVDQHETNMKATKEFAKTNRIKPEDSRAAEVLDDEAERAEKDLKRQDKSMFDRAYIKNQVAMHEKALATLRYTLIPSAQHSDFKAHLEKVASHVAEHLDHAKALQTKLQ